MTTKVLEKELEKESVQMMNSEINQTVALPEQVPKVSPNWANASTFGELKYIGSNEIADIDSDFLPSWIADHVNALAQQYNVPVSVPMIVSLTALSAAVEKRFNIKPHDRFAALDLNIRSLIAADTTNGKSIINALTKPITDIDQEEAERQASSIDRCEVIDKFWDKATMALIRKAARTEVEARTQEVQWGEVYKIRATQKEAQSIVNEASQVNDQKSKIPYVPKRIIVNDVTEKTLPMELVLRHGRMAIISDEVDLLDVMASSAFLQGINGGTFRLPVNGKPVLLDNFSLTAGLLISLRALDKFQNDAKECANKKELLAKSLLCVPKANPSRRNLLNKMVMPGIEASAYTYAMQYLLKIDPPFTLDENTGKHLSGLMTLSHEARGLWFRFTDWLESESGKGGQFELLGDWIDNLPATVLRIATLLHIALLVKKNIDFAKACDKDQRLDALSPLSPLSPFSSENWENNSKISFETMQAAVKLCSKLITHAKVAYGLNDEVVINDKDISYAISWVFNNVKTDENGVLYIKEYDLYRSTRLRKSKAIRKAKIIDKLADLNILSLQVKLHTRKPTAIRFVNPAFIKRFSAYCEDVTPQQIAS